MCYLILFTGSYPYEVAAEHTFLEPELKCLHEKFERIILVPEITTGNKRPVETGIEIEESYAASIGEAIPLKALQTVILAFSSYSFWKEIAYRPRTLIQPKALLRLVRFAGYAERTRKWVLAYIEHQRVDLDKCIFYTYWLDQAALGIGKAKHKYPALRVISRAHGYDVYAYRHLPQYIPCQREKLNGLDRLFLISDNGKLYLTQHYPSFQRKYQVCRLGVKPSGFLTVPSNDGVFRLVSCSYILPVKRLNLLARSLKLLALSHPQALFEWHHIGDGPGNIQLAEEVRGAPENIKIELVGSFTNTEVYAFYRENPVDLFLNTSTSEGIPVSIMEAQSCGIPVIAPAVGGIPEIVNPTNGHLLSRNPTEEEIMQAVWSARSEPELWAPKREESFLTWQRKYHADQNFSSFADQLMSLCSTSAKTNQ